MRFVRMVSYCLVFLLSTLVAQADQFAVLESPGTGLCVDVAGGSTSNGADVVQATCDQTSSQTIRMVPTANTARVFTLRLDHSDKCLEIASSSTSSGANVQQADCDGGSNQEFELVDSGAGNYEIVARVSDLVIGLQSGSDGDGASIKQFDDDDTDHRRWRLTTADHRDPSQYGQWGDVLPWPHIAVSAANLPDGRILTFSGSERETWPTTEFTYSATWDPVAGTFLEIDHMTHNMFCAHLAMTADGQVFVNGGRNQTNSPWTSLFSYQNSSWTQIQNMTSGGRWYPTTLSLTDGDIFTAVGTATNQRNPDRWDATTGWRLLTGIDFQTPVLDYGPTHGEHRWWPLLHLAPQGTIFHSGPTPTVGWINPSGSGEYVDTGLRADDWYHKHGTSIMYDQGRILNAGGWVDGGNASSTDQAFTVNLNGPSPTISNVSAMIHRRKFHNGVMLPNGNVLVVGGNTSGQKFNDNGAVHAAEQWDPSGDEWSELAEMAVPRTYHSIALLLPDARVLAAGGGYCSGSAYCSGSSHRDGQVFSPPYLFNADGTLASRPQITSGPGLIQNDSVFDLEVTGVIEYFSMVKMGSTTHAMNTDVRFLRVDAAYQGGDTHRLTAHTNPNVISPGYWMIFAVDVNGVPSEAHVVRVTNLDVQFENLALSGVASQSSTFQGNTDFEASNGIDGDMASSDVSGSITHTESESNAWWKLDLQSIQSIDSIRIWNRTDCCGERLSNFHVFISDDPFTSTDLATTQAQAGVSDYFVASDPATHLEIGIGRTGRYVRVQLAGTDFLHLAEVQVFGDPPGAGAAGLVHYDYYEGSFDNLPDFNTLTAVSSGTVDGFSLSPRSSDDHFAFRYYGQIDIDSAGDYTFYTNSDDGSRLWINGTMIVDNDGTHGMRERQGVVNLGVGLHDIRVEFFEKAGGQGLTVSYEGPGLSKREIPASVLRLLPDGAGSGTIYREWWTEISGTSISSLTSDPDYPDNPDGSDERVSFEAPTNWNNNYGTKMSGFIYPPFSGDYTFWISSDDNGELWLSSDDTPDNLSLIAHVPSWTSSQDWEKFPEQESSTVFLLSGQRYYVEALQKEGGGGDNLAVAWATPLFNRTVIAGEHLSPPRSDLVISSIDAPPQVITSPVTMTADVSGDNVTYSWSFGDGTPDTPFSSSNSAQHDYVNPGRYAAQLTVRDMWGQQEMQTFQQLVHEPLTADRPNASTTIAFHGGRAEVWNVNPDNDTVSVIDANMNTKVSEIAVADEPRSITVASDGRVWVSSKEAAVISVIDPTTLTVTDTIPLPLGSRPHGIVADHAQPDVYVAVEQTGEVIRYDATTLAEIARSNVGRGIRHLTLSPDSNELLATQFITPFVPGEETSAPDISSVGGVVMHLNPTSLALNTTTLLQHSDRLASEHSGPGLPNYVQAAVVSPDGTGAWVPSKQDNILRGMLRDGAQLTPDHTVRAVSSLVMMPGGGENFSMRIDHDNASVASAAAFGQYGAHMFTALEGNRQVAISDAYLGTELVRIEVGHAPQGLAVSPSGNWLYVHNFMDRSVTVVDISQLATSRDLTTNVVTTIDVVATESLGAEILQGKKLFYDARDTRLASDSYMSCASCHNAGDTDGRTWDFTGVGEGLRNTTTLMGHGGPQHGMLHWTGNFDEVQDFENQIRSFAGGTGLMTDPDFEETEDLLGPPKAGRSADLDALAAYVNSLTPTPVSPHRAAGVTLTADAQVGRALFDQLNCTSCHSGPQMTDSSTGVRHDVGTLKSSSGSRLDSLLTGLDTPSLLGLWASGPYLHDGSAATIGEAITAHEEHAGLRPEEVSKLVAFLTQVKSTDLQPIGPVLELEAETAQLFGGFLVGSDPSASRGGYISVNDGFSDRWSPDRDHRAEFTFKLEKAGTYAIEGRVHAATGDDDSFWVEVNGEGEFLWDVRQNTSYATDFVSDRDGADPVVVTLRAGLNRVTVYLREDGTRLDSLRLVEMKGSPQDIQLDLKLGLGGPRLP